LSVAGESQPVARSRERPPGPRGLDLLHALNDFRLSPLPTLEYLAKRYGDVVCVPVPGRRAFLLSHPDLIHHVLIRRSENYTKTTGTRAARRFFGSSMQLNNGERARSMRRLLAPLFVFDRLARAYGDLIVEETQACIDQWTPGPRPGLTQELMDLLLHIMVRMHFGTPPGEETRHLGSLYSTALALLPEFSLPEWVPTPGNRRYIASVAALDAAVLGRIAASRRNDDGGTDLISEMLRLDLPDVQIRHELISMMAASYGTVGMTLVQTLRLMAENPAADAQVAAEVASVERLAYTTVGGQAPSPVPQTTTAEGQASALVRATPRPDVHKLPYTGKVLKESLRLAPPAGLMMRHTEADDVVGGWAVPAGSRMLLSSWLMQRDPRYYDDPLAFRPERWTPDFERGLPSCAYFPFGAGARSCIGGILSDLTLRLIVATIARRFRLEAAVTPADESAWPLLLAREGFRAVIRTR
jgi:cytochrome P450